MILKTYALGQGVTRTLKLPSMKEVTLKIPDQKFDFFMELIKQLGIEISEEPEIPEEHKAIVRERIRSSKAEDMIPWEEAREQFVFKDKSS